MNFPGVINLSREAASRVDAAVGAIIRLAAAVEANTAAIQEANRLHMDWPLSTSVTRRTLPATLHISDESLTIRNPGGSV